MAGGYVLNFTNREFQDLIKRVLNVDIYSEKYEFQGDSKAKRFRALWGITSDQEIGKILLELLDHWEYENPSPEKHLVNQYNECLKIARKLSGDQSNVDPETEFLKRGFGEISIDMLQIDASLFPILNSRLQEARRCLASNSPLAVIFLCGSILEGLLMGVAIQNPKRFNQATNSPKDKNGKVRPFQDWKFYQFIDVAHELGLLGLDVKKFGHVLREFRNYIHPYQQMASQFNPDRHTAEICLQVLKAAIASLGGERR